MRMDFEYFQYTLHLTHNIRTHCIFPRDLLAPFPDLNLILRNNLSFSYVHRQECSAHLRDMQLGLLTTTDMEKRGDISKQAHALDMEMSDVATQLRETAHHVSVLANTHADTFTLSYEYDVLIYWIQSTG